MAKHARDCIALWKIPTTGVFSTDNGRLLCHAHLGMSAKQTGYDISGHRIRKVTPKLRASDPTFDWECEECYYANRTRTARASERSRPHDPLGVL